MPLFEVRVQLIFDSLVTVEAPNIVEAKKLARKQADEEDEYVYDEHVPEADWPVKLVDEAEDDET